MGDGLARELRELEPPAAPAELPMRDVRAGSVPMLKGVLRFEALRRGGRVLTLAALDVAGMFLAIWTALALYIVPSYLEIALPMAALLAVVVAVASAQRSSSSRLISSLSR